MRKGFILAALAGASVLASASANAAIFVRAFDNNVQFYTASENVPGTGSLVNFGSNANFMVITSATGVPALSDPSFATSTLDMTTLGNGASGRTLVVEFTQTGLTNPTTSFLHTANLNTLNASQLSSAKVETFVGTGAYDTSGSSIVTLTCGAVSNCLYSPTVSTAPHAAVFSETIRYTFAFGTVTSNQAVQGTSQIDAAPLSPVPEPATWAMMLLGFGMIGAAARRSRKISTVLA